MTLGPPLPATESPANPPIGSASPAPGPLPTIPTNLDLSEILARLDTAARRGRLPGFDPHSSQGRVGGFEIRDFGHPFESALLASLAGPELCFTLRLLPRLPIIFSVILILTVWPGVWLTESFLARLGGSFWKWTWHWYIPLTVLSGLWAMHSSLKKSQASARAEAPTLIAKVAAEIARTP